MLRLVRIGLLIVLVLVALSLVMAIGTPVTGPLEKGMLAAGVVGLIALARPLRRVGQQ